MLKIKALNIVRQRLEDQCHKTREQLTGLRQALEGETKSSAGDKHETGRAMVQLEMERASARLQLQEKELKRFEVLAFNKGGNTDKITAGNLVVTDKATYFLLVSVGMIQIENTPVAVISASSPIGGLLLGKTVGDSFVFNGNTQKITAVY